MDKLKLAIVSILLTAIMSLGNIKTKQDYNSFSMVSAVSSPIYIESTSLANIMEVRENSLVEIVKIADAVIECESGNKMIYGDNGNAYGIAQFWKDTFEMMKRKSGMYWLDYYSMQDQRTLLVWALEHNLGFHWTCYRKLYN